MSDDAASWSDLNRSGVMRVIVLVSFGAWLHGADELMVSTITPQIVGDIGGAAHVAWLTALYEVGSIVAAACTALLVGRFGLSRSMMSAALVYGFGCLVSGVAPSIETMLAGRLLQGLGGGAMIALAFVTIQRQVEPRLMARAYAVLSMAWGFAAFAGPMTGALFAEAGHWRGAFHFYAIQAVAFATLAFFLLPGIEKTERISPAFPWRVFVLAAGVISIAQAGVERGVGGAISFAVAGLLLIGLFFAADARKSAKDRMFPRTPWRMQLASSAALMLVLFMAMSTMGFITYGPLFLNRLHDVGPVEAGSLLLLESIGWSVSAIFISGMAPRLERRLIIAGLSLVTFGTALFAYAIPAGVMPLVALGALLQGGGFGIAWSFMMRRTVMLTDGEDKDRIAAAIPTTQRLGYALGAAFAGMLVNGYGFADGATVETVRYAAVALFALSLVPAFIGLSAMLRLVSMRLPE